VDGDGAETRSSTAPWPSTTTATACGTLNCTTATRCTVGKPDPEFGPGLEVSQGRRGTSQAAARGWPTPRHRTDHLAEPDVQLRQRARRLRRHLGRQPRRRVLVRGPCPGCYNTTGQTSARKPSSINFVILVGRRRAAGVVDGHATHRQVRHRGRHTRLLTASGVHSNNGTKSTPSLAADHPRRLAGGAYSRPDHRQPLAADLLQHRPDQHLARLAAAGPPVPRGRRLAEHRLQPAPARPASRWVDGLGRAPVVSSSKRFGHRAVHACGEDRRRGEAMRAWPRARCPTCSSGKANDHRRRPSGGCCGASRRWATTRNAGGRER